jgi:hypothetical protein
VRHWPVFNFGRKNPNAKTGLTHADPQELIASMRDHEAEAARFFGRDRDSGERDWTMKEKRGVANMNNAYAGIYDEIVALLDAARRANALMTATYWEIGRRIVEFEQRGKKRAAAQPANRQPVL